MPEVLQPRQVGSRPRAQEMLAELPDDLTGAEVRVDFRSADTAAPSFIDEIIAVVLQERNARVLKLENVAPRIARYADRSAVRRDVADRLLVDRLP